MVDFKLARQKRLDTVGSQWWTCNWGNIKRSTQLQVVGVLATGAKNVGLSYNLMVDLQLARQKKVQLRFGGGFSTWAETSVLLQGGDLLASRATKKGQTRLQVGGVLAITAEKKGRA